MKKKTLTYSTSQRGKLTLNLNDRRLNFTHLDFNGGGVIPIPIFHVYQNNGIDKGYGTGFRLNLDQSLTKIDNTSKYKLSLPDGSEELFEEIYYYLNEEDERVYQTSSGQTLQRSDIEVLEDGSLHYENHLIFVELKSNTGLTLKSDYKDFINSDSIHLKNEDIVQLENEIQQLENSIEEANKDLEIQKVNYVNDTQEYIDVRNSRSQYQDSSKELMKAQLAAYNFKEKEKIYRAKIQYYNKTEKENNIVGGLESKNPNDYIAENIYYKASLNRFTFKDELGRHAEGFALMDKYKDKDKFEQISGNVKLAEYCSQRFTDEVERLNQEIQKLALEMEQADIENQKKITASQSDLMTKEENYLNKQKALEELQNKRLEKYYEKIEERTNLHINQYSQLIQQKQSQLNVLYKHIPELYLINEEGLIFGYNKYGKLCTIFDTYEHQVLIEYNEDDQIKSIVDSENHKVELIYNGKKKLIRLINDYEEFIDFNYEGNYLTRFTYSNGNCFILNYINKQLFKIQDVDGIGYQIEYQNNLISKLKSISLSSQTPSEELSFIYDSNLISISNNKNLLTYHYLFDDKNSLTTEYCLKENEIEEITTFDDGLHHCNFTISSNKTHSKILDVGPMSIEDINSFTAEPLNSYLTDYILYARIKADVSEGIRQRRVTAYCEHFYTDQDTECRCEIRCMMHYETHSKEYSVSVNPQIKGEQIIAIPVTFDEDINGQVLIPNRIMVSLDCRGNDGGCELLNLVMAQGEFIYCENNETHHKVYECFSEVSFVKNELLEKQGSFIQKKEVNYFYNPKELLEQQITKLTYTEYDTDSMLIHREVKEIKTQFIYNTYNKVIKESNSLGNVIEYIYNAQGACIQKKSYNEIQPNLVHIEESELDKDGKVISTTNELGYKTTYQQLNHKPVSLTTPNGNILYIHDGYSAKTLSSDENGLENYNTCIYDQGKLVEYKTEGMQYSYTYDELGKEKELYINNKIYCRFIEIESMSKIYNKTLYNDGTGYEKVSDLYGKILKINKIKNDVVLSYIEYVYDSKEKVIKEINHENDKETSLEYVYVEDTLVGIKTDEYIKTVAKDMYGNEKELAYQIGVNTHKYSCEYDDKNRVTVNRYTINQESIFTEHYRYDGFDRIKEANYNVIKNKYDYLTINGRTTNYIKCNQKEIQGKYQRYNYDYDKEGNIVCKKENHKLTRYAYDGLNRLVREDNEALNETILYSYDGNGNLLEKNYFDYSITDQLENKRVFELGYKDFNDYLTCVNNKQIAYDSIGNPVIYKNIPLVWDSKELKKYNDIEFTYNANHIRTRKKTGKSDTIYILDGTKILKEIRKNYTTFINGSIDEGVTIDTYDDEIEYIYSAEGIVGFDYITENSRKRYYYNKNMFGDILEIYDENGSLVGEYCYDAYGNHKILIDIDHIASINPIRYRSYYFDSETQLYYLNSRYYDPDTCRFINMDSIEYLNFEQLNGFNLFAYCNNNPIKYIDPAGTSALLIGLLIFMGVMTIGGAAYGGISAGMAGGNIQDIFAGIGKGALNGFIISGGISLAIGGFSIGATSIIGSIMATYGLSITANMLEVAVTQGKKSYYDGDDFWAGANDINNAMFSNSGGILVGNVSLLPIPIYGTRLVYKIPTFIKTMNEFRWANAFRVSFMTSAKNTLTQKANKFALLLGYLITLIQYKNLFESIFSKPDFDNSKWILY